MSLRVCSRRLQTSAATLHAIRQPVSSQLPLLRRAISSTPSYRATNEAPKPYTNPIIQDYLKKRPQHAAAPQIQQGDLASDSIFGSDAPAQATTGQDKGSDGTVAAVPLSERNPEYMRMAIDPNPRGRIQWERKMVIRSIHRRGRLTKAETIMRTERQLLHKSDFLKTSVKKLSKLANQIAGKSVDDALVQMRFSKKRVAQDVKKALEEARDNAVVTRGMGLGGLAGADTTPVEIELKGGKRKVIKDPTEMYVSQAWVGRGEFTREIEYRGRGRANVRRKPETSISFVLKEEHTRIRLNKERLEKRRNRKLWVQLPNRPITAQRQYALW